MPKTRQAARTLPGSWARAIPEGGSERGHHRWSRRRLPSLQLVATERVAPPTYSGGGCPGALRPVGTTRGEDTLAWHWCLEAAVGDATSAVEGEDLRRPLQERVDPPCRTRAEGPRRRGHRSGRGRPWRRLRLRPDTARAAPGAWPRPVPALPGCTIAAASTTRSIASASFSSPGSERLDERGGHRTVLGLRVGDPNDEVLGAWLANESARDIYLTDDPDEAALWSTRPSSAAPKTTSRRSRRSDERWRRGAPRSSSTNPGASNGPTEGLNLCVKR